MADQMRNRLVYTVFSPKEEGARDLLLAGFREAYPEASDEDYQLAVESADNALAYADNLGMDLALAPSGKLEMVSPIDVSIGWEYAGHDLFAEILNERGRQYELGYTEDHDDNHGGEALIGIAKRYLEIPEGADTGLVRQNLVKAIATLVATVELVERAERRLQIELENQKTMDEIQRLNDQFRKDHGDAAH